MIVNRKLTFLPALVPLLTVEALPMCWWLPPPWGCSTGFMATPRTLGQQFRLALYLKYARPAFSTGLSILPPPATIPRNPQKISIIIEMLLSSFPTNHSSPNK